MIRDQISSYLLLPLLTLSVTGASTDKPAQRRFTITISENQMVLAVIIACVLFLVLTSIIVNLSIFSYSHQHKQQAVMSQLTEILATMTTLHQQSLIPNYKRSRPSSILRNKSVTILEPSSMEAYPVLQSGTTEASPISAKKTQNRRQESTEKIEKIMEV